MESGEKELRKAFEEVTIHNVKSSIEYSNNTRVLVRLLEKKVDLLEGNIRQYQEQMELLKTQLNNIQTKIYKGGTS